MKLGINNKIDTAKEEIQNGNILIFPYIAIAFVSFIFYHFNFHN